MWFLIPFLIGAVVVASTRSRAPSRVLVSGAPHAPPAMPGPIVVLGEFSAVGPAINTTWTRLAQTASAGTSQITLSQPVSWRAGQTVALTATNYNATRELEELTIASVSADGLRVTFTTPLAYTHFAGVSSPVSHTGAPIVVAAAAGLLSRNITIRGNQTGAAQAFPHGVSLFGDAGGAAAVFRSQEGAEDARDTGVAELKARGLTKKDVVCGIAASGQTPFVLAALDYARDLGAGTILLTCNPKRTIRVKVDVEIDLPTGPEIVTGSTRMKAGTATKLVLNMLSTIAMVRLGRVRDNLMVNVQATNDKLRARAVRLVQALTNASFDDAQAALEKKAWRVTDAAAALPGKSRRKRK